MASAINSNDFSQKLEPRIAMRRFIALCLVMASAPLASLAQGKPVADRFVLKGFVSSMTVKEAQSHCSTLDSCASNTKKYPPTELQTSLPLNYGKGTKVMFRTSETEKGIESISYRFTPSGQVMSFGLYVSMDGVGLEDAREAILERFADSLGKPTMTVPISRDTIKIVWGCYDKDWVSRRDNAAIGCTKHDGHIVYAEVYDFERASRTSMIVEWIALDVVRANREAAGAEMKREIDEQEIRRRRQLKNMLE